MCIVSNIGDGYRDKFKERWQFKDRWPDWVPSSPTVPDWAFPLPIKPAEVSKEDFDKLVKEVKQLKKLLIAAKKFDEQSGQPDCEMDEKVEFIKRLGELLGVDMSKVFGN